MFYYQLFGFDVTSEIQLGELPVLREMPAGDVISIQYGTLDWPKSRDIEVVEREFYYEEDISTIRFWIRGIGAYEISEGTRILIEPSQTSRLDHVVFYLLGTAMGLLMFQKGVYPLHGSSVALDWGSMIIVGESGAGKSTLAYALMSQGYRLLSDDMTRVEIRGDQCLAFPSYPRQKLWRDALSRFNLSPQNQQQLFSDEEKYMIKANNSFCHVPQEIRAIVVLRAVEQNQGLTLQALPRDLALGELIANTYRREFLASSTHLRSHLHSCAKIAGSVPVYLVERPLYANTIEEIIEKLANKINLTNKRRDIG